MSMGKSIVQRLKQQKDVLGGEITVKAKMRRKRNMKLLKTTRKIRARGHSSFALSYWLPVVKARARAGRNVKREAE